MKNPFRRQKRRGRRATVEDAIKILGKEKVCTYDQVCEKYGKTHDEPSFFCSVLRLEHYARENKRGIAAWRLFCDLGHSLQWLVGRFGWAPKQNPGFCQASRNWLEPTNAEVAGWIVNTRPVAYYLVNFKPIFRY